MLFFSHFATHAVCSSPYLLTTLACQTCFATWQQGVVSSLKSWYSVFLVCWSGAELHCWKLAVCNPGAKLPSSGPASSFAKVFFLFVWCQFCATVTSASSEMNWKNGPQEPRCHCSPISEIAESQTSALSNIQSLSFQKTFNRLTWGLWHWLTNDWQKESRCTFSLLSTSPVCYFSHRILNLFL